MKLGILKFSILVVIVLLLASGFSQYVKKQLNRSGDINPQSDQGFSYVPIPRNELTAATCGEQVTVRAIFEVVFLKGINDLSKSCFDKVGEIANFKGATHLPLLQESGDFNSEILEQTSFIALARSLGASQGKEQQIIKNTERLINDNLLSNNKKFISGARYLRSYSLQFEATHHNDRTDIAVYFYHQLPLPVESLQVIQNSETLPLKVLIDGKEMDFQHHKKTLTVTISTILSPKLDAVTGELTPTVMTLTFYKDGQIPLGMINKISVNSGNEDLKRVPYVNNGVNLAATKDIYHCWSIDKFKGNWPSQVNRNKENYEVYENQIILREADYEFTDTVHFPCNFDLVIGPGTTIKMGPKVSLFVSGSLLINGTPLQPIEFEQLNSSEPWGALVVLPNGESKVFNEVKISNASFRGGSETFGYGRLFTGMVSILKASVTLDSVNFDNNFGEDQLNLIDSKINIKGIRFSKAFSDAFDVDWCIGSISNVMVNETGEGGDGIDFSYSDVTLSNVTGKYISDKGISVGERSKVNISNILVESALYGVVSKDSSTVNLQNATFNEVETPIGAYVKKAHFVGGVINTREIERVKSGSDYRDNWSTINTLD